MNITNLKQVKHDIALDKWSVKEYEESGKQLIKLFHNVSSEARAVKSVDCESHLLQELALNLGLQPWGKTPVGRVIIIYV